MTAKWASTIGQAAEEQPADLESAVRAELECLWSDLDHAITRAYRGGWSVGCEQITVRIVQLSRFAGPTHWGNIPVTLLLNGTYQGILADAGFKFDMPGGADLRQMERWHRSEVA